MKKSKLLNLALSSILAFTLVIPSNCSAKVADTKVADTSIVLGTIGFIQPVENEVELAFSSGSEQDTHQYIVKSALRILQNDKGFSKLHTYADTISCFADWPDELGHETDYGTYAGHFYDPDTGKNWQGKTSPTAKSRAESYFNQAVSWYRQGEYEEACICLGKGSHYVADLNEPHHASNLTALNSNHSDFEKYVNNNLSSYAISGNTFSSSVYSSAKSTSLSSMLISGARYAKGLAANAQNKSKYSVAAKSCVQHAIQNEVQYYYKFGVTVGIYK